MGTSIHTLGGFPGVYANSTPQTWYELCQTQTTTEEGKDLFELITSLGSLY